MSRSPRLVAGVMLLLTFVVGALAGMGLEEGLGLDWFDFLDEDSEVADSGLLTGLDLDEAQTETIEQILEDQEESLEAYWESRIPDLRAIVTASYEEVRTVLTPEQREVFDRRIQAQGVPVPRSPD